MTEHAEWTKAATRVVESINAGTLAPGDVVRQWDLSAEKTVPREITEEAMRFLESAGVMQRLPELGWVVRTDVRIPVQGPP